MCCMPDVEQDICGARWVVHVNSEPKIKYTYLNVNRRWVYSLYSFLLPACNRIRPIYCHKMKFTNGRKQWQMDWNKQHIHNGHAEMKAYQRDLIYADGSQNYGVFWHIKSSKIHANFVHPNKLKPRVDHINWFFFLLCFAKNPPDKRKMDNNYDIIDSKWLAF